MIYYNKSTSYLPFAALWPLQYSSMRSRAFLERCPCQRKQEKKSLFPLFLFCFSSIFMLISSSVFLLKKRKRKNEKKNQRKHVAGGSSNVSLFLLTFQLVFWQKEVKQRYQIFTLPLLSIILWGRVCSLRSDLEFSFSFLFVLFIRNYHEE